MVIPLGKMNKKTFYQTRNFRGAMELNYSSCKRNRPYVYTCKNLDAKTGNCKIYNERPKMCRTFPDGADHCEFKKCTDKKLNLKHLLSQGKVTEFWPITLVCRFENRCLCVTAGKVITLKWGEFLARYLMEHKKHYNCKTV